MAKSPKTKHIQQIKTNCLRWVFLNNNTKREINWIRDNFSFHPLDLEDCLSPAQRPKLDTYDDYIFMIMTFPYFDRSTREIMPSEVDFFIGPDYLIMVTDGKLPLLKQFFEQCQLNDTYRQKYLNDSPVKLLSEILNKLQHYLNPMLDHISIDINNIQKVIFEGYEKKMVREILMVKRNIINFRKIMQAHKNIIRKLMTKKDKFFIPNEINVFLTNNLEQAKDVWDNLEELKESIEALHNTNESLISFRLNDIMKVLTMISVVLLPINLVASIFGMNTPIMPLVNHVDGFWIILSLMLVMILAFIFFFKKKNWL